MILFFDTETTGFVDDRLPLDHEAQPHIVQLAAQLCEEGGDPVAGFSLIVDPGISANVKIPERASAVHGITEERAVQLGVSVRSALALFIHLRSRAKLLVAHNIKFDLAVVQIGLARCGQSTDLAKPTFCTMEAASPVVNLPPTERMRAAGYNKPKPPKLEECIRHFFGEELAGAHDAMVDVAACRRVFFALKSAQVPS